MLVLVSLKSMPTMLLLCYTNTQSFVHNKSSSTSQLIKGILSDLRKLPRYLSRIETSTSKVGAGGRAAWLVSPTFPACAGLSFVLTVIFVSHLNDLLSEGLSLTLSTSSL